ncbi:PAS domain S-box protein [Sphingomonas sp. Leaf4]|uniref:PAS domain S-box protein n=1 Tax=Sphingomonas sp. Leaf4 TaxID=2876553 RepID=UPI001E2A812E|nr:PAS domain S-box protein [Sphingomonas sp. Leaf4]
MTPPVCDFGVGPAGWSETERVAALGRYAILDTPREQVFDDIVRLASDIFDAPMAVVNLVAGGRQWFKAEVGIGADELPLDVSICVHAIRQHGIFVVPDMTLDTRFAANPLVTGAPGLRFYAGAPIETPEGLPIGTVCVLDTRPRPDGITDRQRLTLELLARQVMTQLELRRQLAVQDERARALEAEIAARRDADDALRASDRKLNAVLDNTRMAVFLMNEEQHCVYANAAAEELTGYSLAEMQGRPLHDVVHHTRPDGSFYPLADCPIDRAFPERAQMEGEELFVARDGSFYPVAFTASPLLDDAGRPVGTVIEARNIQHRRARDAALRESEARFRNMADHAPMMMWVTDVDGRCTYLNRAWYDFTGQNERETVADGFGWLDAVHPDDRGWSGETFLAANVEHTPFRLEYRLRRHDGAYRWAIDAASPRFDGEGAFLGYVGSVIDIGERREMEDALRRSEERYRTLFDTIEVGFCIVEVMFDGDRAVDYRFVEANPALERQTGLVGVAGRTARELVPGLEQRWFDLYGGVATSGDAIRFEDGSDVMGRWFDVHALRVGDPADRRVAILFNDISDRRRVQIELERLNRTLEERIDTALAERKLWADVVENSDALIGILSPDYRYLALNTAYADDFARVYGVRPVVGDTLTGLMEQSSGDLDGVMAMWTRALSGEEFTITEDFGDPDLDRPYYELRFNTLRDERGRRIGAFQYAVDVTERLRNQARLTEAEQQLRQAQKMEAVGQLTGGIAHDFNNMLAVTIGSLDLLDRRIGAGDARAKRYIAAATDGARRAANLTQRLLAFSRQQPLRPEPVDANKLTAGMSDLLRHSLGGDVRLETVLAGGLWRTCVDANQLENVILNLAINARDAMADGGRVTIETQNAHLDDRYAAAHPGVAAGQYVLIAVTDSGTGMPPAVIAKAFDPFFTTKEVGKGTGLGLSQTYGFVKQSGGHVKIYSEPGEGTSVKVYLPRLLNDVAEAPASEQTADLPVGHQREVVLVVEDEPSVRQFSVEVLSELGYRTLEADSAAMALRLLDAHPEIALLFTDVVMPEMNGARLVDEARRRRGDLKVLFTTGYTRNAIVHNGVLEPGVDLISKPFTIEELAARVRAVLDRPL